MPQPKKHDSNTARQMAYRERVQAGGGRARYFIFTGCDLEALNGIRTHYGHDSDVQTLRMLLKEEWERINK